MKLASTSLFTPRALLLLLAGGALVTAAACTVTTGDGEIDDEDPAVPNPTSDGGGTGDATSEASAADGGSCSLAVTFTNLGAACNTCLAANCCEAVNGCYASPAPDGGVSCEDYEQCVNTCRTEAAEDGGTPVSECVSTVCDLAAESSPGAKSASAAWRTCAETDCSAECSGL